MLNFSAISIHDQEKLAPLLADNHARVNERSFASMYVCCLLYTSRCV